MRILYLIRDPYPTTRQDVLTLFGHRLLAKGIASDIVATVRPGVSATSHAWPGGQAYLNFSAHNPLINAFQIFVQALRMLLRAEQYDAVVVRDRIVTAIIALVIVRKIPVYYWMSYPFPEEDLSRSKLAGRGLLFRLALRLRGLMSYWLMYRVIVPHASHLFVQSEQMATAVRHKAATRREMTVVPMGVDEQKLCDLPNAISCPQLEGRFVLAYLGELDRFRRIDFLLDVILWLKPRSPKIALLLVGEGNSAEMIWLSQSIRDMGLSGDVIMTGQLPTSKAWAYLRAAKIGLSAIPRGEVFDVSSPTKVVEYLALGIPVVANDIPDQSQLLEATGAGICVEMTVEKFGQSILDIAADYERYKQRASDCLGNLMKSRGYNYLSDVVAKILLAAHSS